MKIRTLALCLLATAACRSSSTGNNPDAKNNGNPDSSSSDDTSIYDIQDPTNVKVPVGTIVNVRGAVVTAVDEYGNKTSNFWIEEPGGGPYSGVLVFKADNSVVMTLAPGDLVDVVGAEKAEFALSSDTSGRTTTELEPPSGGAIQVTKVGTGTVPTPSVVDALQIGQMADPAAQDAEWEKWEGVLITVDNVGVISSTKSFGSSPGPDALSFNVTGPLTVESTLAAFPDTTMVGKGPQFGDCLGSITGVGDYFFNWLLEPRTTADVSIGGSGCPVAETGATACGDSIDNDANGHKDCFDYSCMLDQPGSCVQAATVHDVDTGVQPVGSGVNLTGRCVAAVDSAGKQLWIADAGQAALDSGVYVFRGSNAAALAGISKGTVVDVANAVILPFHGLMELNGIPGSTSPTPAVTKANGPGCTVAPLTTDLATLADTTMSAHYNGSLVTIGKAKVTAVTGTGNKTIYTLSDGTKTIEMGVQIYAPVGVVAGTTCYASVTGIATLDTSPNPSVPMILPTAVTDLPAGTGCP